MSKWRICLILLAAMFGVLVGAAQQVKSPESLAVSASPTERGAIRVSVRNGGESAVIAFSVKANGKLKKTGAPIELWNVIDAAMIRRMQPIMPGGIHEIMIGSSDIDIESIEICGLIERRPSESPDNCALATLKYWALSSRLALTVGSRLENARFGAPTVADLQRILDDAKSPALPDREADTIRARAEASVVDSMSATLQNQRDASDAKAREFASQLSSLAAAIRQQAEQALHHAMPDPARREALLGGQ
ncbi:MAG: hypothetical protein KIT83_20970 [Bryobacterales bacterium]|nr:hypothetical protein [Bryobacterales bacterium]